MKLEFKDGFIEINKNGTITTVGECARTYYYAIINYFNKSGLGLNEAFEETKAIIVESIRNGGVVC